MKRFFKWTRETGEGQLVLTLILLALVAGALLGVLNHFGLLGTENAANDSVLDDPNAVTSVSLTKLVTLIEEGEVESLKVGIEEAEVVMQSGVVYTVTLGDLRAVELVEFLGGIWALQERGVSVSMAPSAKSTPWGTIIMIAFPIVLIGGMLLASRKMGGMGAGGSAQTFGQSKARMLAGDKPVVTFDDVAGCEEAKEELQEIVEFLKEPEKFISMGARIPKGVLLVGAPGTGKTLMAKAVSGEAGVPFFSISGSEFVEMYVGVGASRVRDLFTQAKRNSPCIVFVDEIDAMGRNRATGGGVGGHDEREQTLNQMLVEMDGFDTDTNVIILAATNRPDILDPALLRPGRFDRQTTLHRPDLKARVAILEVHARGKPLAAGVDLKAVAVLTAGLVGADLEAILNEAAILAAKLGRRDIGMDELYEAILRVHLGRACKSRLINDEDKKITAYHEGGHALVAEIKRRLGLCEPVELVTIIPRGMTGGTTWYRDEDLGHHTRARLKARLATGLGGRAAEELVFGRDGITEGASQDLIQVTDLAQTMVARLAMTDKLPPRAFVNAEEGLLGGSASRPKSFSEATAAKIDAQIERLLRAAYKEAKDILAKHRDALEAIVERLLEVETIEADEFVALVAQYL